MAENSNTSVTEKAGFPNSSVLPLKSAQNLSVFSVLGENTAFFELT